MELVYPFLFWEHSEMLYGCRTERLGNECWSLFLFWSIAKLPDGCRIARFRDGHMETDLGQHLEGLMAAIPQSLAPTMRATEGFNAYEKCPLYEQRFACITRIPLIASTRRDGLFFDAAYICR